MPKIREDYVELPLRKDQPMYLNPYLTRKQIRHL